MSDITAIKEEEIVLPETIQKQHKRTTNIKTTYWLVSTGIKASSDSIVSPFIPLYGEFLGVSKTTIGFIVSITSLLSIFQIIWAQVAQKFKLTRILAFISNYVSSAMIFLYIIKNIIGFTVIRGFQSIIGSAAIPTGSALLAERTETKDWGFWNSIIQGIIVFGALVGTLFGGFILKQTQIVEDNRYIIIFAISAVLSILSAIFFQFAVPSQKRLEKYHQWSKIEEVEISLNNTLSTMRTEKNFAVFCGVNFIFTFGVNLAGPFFIIFNRDTYGIDIFYLALLTSIGLIPQMISSIVTSKFINRVRKKELVMLGGFITSFFPVAYIIPYLVLNNFDKIFFILIGLWLINSTAWGIINAGLSTLTFDIIHPRRRTLQLSINNSISAIALFIAPIIGGYIFEKTPHLTYVLFIISGVIRLLGIILFIFVKEPIIGGTLLSPIRRILPVTIRSNAEKQIVTYVSSPREKKSWFFHRKNHKINEENSKGDME